MPLTRLMYDEFSMGYQVLARKWRPRFFDEMVGQEHVLRALINALNGGRLHHAYLFTGTRGVGKTTIARILAKCLNCEQGVSARPCGECSSCREIAEGRFVDLIEVDAASRTRVEDTRELLDNVQYAPTRGRYKVYLIDEVHMLSTHSFNALLKTLEEPPEHVKFLLATTDPQKLPVTVLSRCLQFSLKNMTAERIVDYLQHVLNSEEIGFQEPALWALGRAAQGSMRDALSLTDQAIAYGEGHVGEEQVNAMLGTMDRGRLFKLAEIMAQGNANQILAEVADMADHSPDYDEVLQGLLAIWHKVALGQVVPDAVDNAEGDRQAILKLSTAMAAEDVQLYYQIGLQGRKDLELAGSPRQGFEMVLLRMLAFRPAPSEMPSLDLVTSLEKKNTQLVDSVQDSDIGVAAFSKAEAEPESSPAHVTNESLAIATSAEMAVESIETAVPEVLDGPALIEASLPETSLSETSLPETPSLSEVASPAKAPVVDVPWEQGDTLAPPSDMALQDTRQAESTPLAEPIPSSRSVSSISAMSLLSEDHAPVVSQVDGGQSPSQEDAANLLSAYQPSELSSGEEVDDGLSDSGGHQGQPLGQPDAEMASQHEPMAVNIEDEPVAELGELQPSNWYQWVEKLTLGGLPLAIAKNSALILVEADNLYFDVDPAQGALFNDSQRQRIEQALKELLPRCRVHMELQPTRTETPEQRRQRQLSESLYAARQAIDSDGQVATLVNDFGGYVIEESIRPVR